MFSLRSNASSQHQQLVQMNSHLQNATQRLDDLTQTQQIIVSEVSDVKFKVNDLEGTDLQIEVSENVRVVRYCA